MKKGFTLIELIAVIILLAAIALLTYPAITGMINDSREKGYKEQINLILEAAHKWGIENVDKLDETYETVIPLDKLINEGYIAKTDNGMLIDPRTDEEINGCVVISYTSSFNQYEYNFSDQCRQVQPPVFNVNSTSNTNSISLTIDLKSNPNTIDHYEYCYKVVGDSSCQRKTSNNKIIEITNLTSGSSYEITVTAIDIIGNRVDKTVNVTV